MDERLRFVARLLDGESMTEVCRQFGISRKTAYKIFARYQQHGGEALSDRSRRPVRYANQLPQQIETLIGAHARFASCWCAAWTAICASPPRALSTPCCIDTAWSSRCAARDRAPPEHPYRPARHPTICGAPISRASSSSATGATATR